MSINALGVLAINSTQQVDNDSVAKAAASKSHVVHQPATSGDTTSFTSDKQTVQTLQKVAIEPFPSRQTRVEALKQAVHSAQYQLDNAKIAASLVEAIY